MEGLANFAPSGNLRTPIQKAKKKVNALVAEEKEMRVSVTAEAREFAIKALRLPCIFKAWPKM